MIAPSTEAPPDDQVGTEPQLRLHDLGSLVVEVGGDSSAIRGAKPMRILATLLINANRRVSVDALVDAVWGERATDASVGTLESHIWRLRRAMEPARDRSRGRGRSQEPTYLVNDNAGYRLIVNPEHADSLRFAQLAEQGDRLLASGEPERARHRFESALELWRGRPFDAVADEEWAAAPIARLEELYGQVNEQYVEALLRTGERPRAINELEAMTGRLPFREQLWRQLMLGLYHDGRVEEALATYGRARNVLLDTLGLEPGPELRDLQQRILNQDPALDPPVPPEPRSATEPPAAAPAASADVHLPSRLAELVGREVELVRLRQLLERNPLVTLVGAGGCGKTRLAIDLARAAAATAPDGVWFVDLAAVDDPAAVTETVTATIGMAAPTVGTPISALRSYVRDHRILLLIDNCEHVLGGVYRLLDALLADDSQCRVLATSREPVGFDGEVLWTVAPLATRGATQAVDEPLSAAAQLFMSRAERVVPHITLTGEALVEIEAICAAVDGIPLAVELAAGRLRSASLAEIRQQVETELGSLGGIGPAHTEHHRTVEKSIEWSARLLDADEQLVHARLSVLPGFFTLAAAASVTGAAPLRPGQIPELLDRLVHRSLVAVVLGEQPGEATRFRQLATVRAHANHALANTGEDGATLERRAAFVRDLVATRPPEYAADEADWYGTIADNHDTLTAVLRDTVRTHPSPAGARLVADVAHYWFYRGHTADGVRWLEAARRIDGVPAAVQVELDLTLAALSGLRDRSDLADQLTRGALAKIDDSIDRRGVAYLLLAALSSATIRDETALAFVPVEIHRLTGEDPMIELWAETADLRTAAATEAPADVAARARELVERAEQVGNVSTAWLASWQAAQYALQAGDLSNGPAWFRRGDEHFRRLGGTPVPMSLDTLGVFAALSGDHEQAATHFARASRMAFRAGLAWPASSEVEGLLTETRAVLPTERFEAAWRAGEALPG